MFKWLAVISSIPLALSEASQILAKLNYFIGLAEQIGGEGEAKLASVKAGMLAYITTNFPKLIPAFDTLWTELEGIVNGTVSILNELGGWIKTVETVVTETANTVDPIITGVTGTAVAAPVPQPEAA